MCSGVFPVTPLRDCLQSLMIWPPSDEIQRNVQLTWMFFSFSFFCFFPAITHHVIRSHTTASSARDHVHRTDTYQAFLINKALLSKLESLHCDCRLDQHARNLVVDRCRGWCTPPRVSISGALGPGAGSLQRGYHTYVIERGILLPCQKYYRCHQIRRRPVGVQ